MTRYTISINIDVPDSSGEAFERTFKNSDIGRVLRRAIDDLLYGKPAFGNSVRYAWVTDDIEDSDKYQNDEMYDFKPNYRIHHAQISHQLDPSQKTGP